MNFEEHQRARKLLESERIEGISPQNREWLDSHLDSCPDCMNEANAVAFAVDSLRSVSVMASADLVERTRLMVQRRAEQRREAREHALPLWIAVGVASVWMILTAPFTWSLFAWLGRTIAVSDVIWEIAFLMWWFLPATVLGVAAAWHRLGDVYDNR